MPDVRDINVPPYLPLDSQAAFHNSQARVKAYMGPMGSGKSSAGGHEWRLACEEAEVPLRGIVLRESFRQLNDSTRKTFEEWFPPPVAIWKETDKKYLFTWPNFKGDYLTHELNFRHARRAAEASNLLSTEYSWFWFEEPVPAFQIAERTMGNGLPEEFFDFALGRRRQKGVGKYTMILTFNPPPTFHWCHKRFVAPSKAKMEARGFELFRSPKYENKVNLPDNYYEDLEENWDVDMIRRFIDGDCINLYPGQPVFSQFYEQMHFRKELVVMGLPMILALDFGLTPCALFCQVTPMGQLRIYRELQMKKSGAVELGEAIREIMKAEFPGLKIKTIWGDPAGEAEAQTDRSTPFGIIAKILETPVHPGEQRIFTRLEGVRQRARQIIDGEPGIIIDSMYCPTLMEGLLGAYRYPQSQGGLIGAKPLKNMFSHLADALQYLCCGEFNVISGEQTRPEEDDEPKVVRLPRYNPLAPNVQSRNTGRSWMVN